MSTWPWEPLTILQTAHPRTCYSDKVMESKREVPAGM